MYIRTIIQEAAEELNSNQPLEAIKLLSRYFIPKKIQSAIKGTLVNKCSTQFGRLEEVEGDSALNGRVCPELNVKGGSQ